MRFFAFGFDGSLIRAYSACSNVILEQAAPRFFAADLRSASLENDNGRRSEGSEHADEAQIRLTPVSPLAYNL